MNELLSLPFFVEARAYALAVAVSGACVCGLVLLAARPFKRRSEVSSYGILLGGVAGLLAVPVLVGSGRSLPATVFWPPPAPEEAVVKVPAERLEEILAPPAVGLPLAEETPAWDPSEVFGAALVAAWLLGLFFGLGRLAYGLCKRQRAILARPWQADFWTDELKGQLASKLGLKEFPDVYLSPMAPMPMVIGILRPKIVLPEQAPSWAQPQWEAILLHEAAHIARRDPWGVLAQRLAVILFWWCPLVYALGRRLNELRESICDDYALQGSCDHIAYAEVLVESAERLLSLKTLPLPVALLDSARGGLEARVIRLLEKEKRPMTKLSLPGKILGAGFLAAACLLTTATTALSGGQAQPEKKVQIKVVVDGKEFDLGDLQLWDRTEPAPKQSTTVTADVKHVLSSGEDKTVRVWGAESGKPVLAGPRDQVRYVVQTVIEAKPDPRIEELVRQAEAIKPGSGAQIRAALEGTPRAGERAARVTVSPEKVHAYSVKVGDKATPALRLETTAGKKIIILSIEDGNVVQLKEQDLKKIIEKGIRLDLRDTAKRPVSAETKKPAGADTKQPAAHVELELKQAVRGRTPETKAEPARTNELDSLRRQLERISAELKALQQRLDAPRK